MPKDANFINALSSMFDSFCAYVELILRALSQGCHGCDMEAVLSGPWLWHLTLSM